MGQTSIGDKNTDFSKFATVNRSETAWIDSPEDGVSRIPLDRIGGEMARHVTPIVRYHPGASFHKHNHPGGEEILVLDGVFSDENGDHPPGHYILNPPGYVHAPFSEEGCVIFVKLGQYGGDKRESVRIDTRSALRAAGDEEDVTRITLYQSSDYPERAFLYRLKNAAAFPVSENVRGVEIYIVEGTLAEGERRHGEGIWLRFPPGQALALAAAPSRVIRAAAVMVFFIVSPTN